MKIAIGSDHAGFQVKQMVGEWLQKHGHDVVDVGTNSTEPVDYPDFAEAVAKQVASSNADAGVLVCGTGMGMCIAANKVDGIRAAHPANVTEAALSRSHNNANVVCLAGRTEDPDTSLSMLDEFLKTPFSGDDRHVRRLEKIAKLEEEQ